MKKFLNVAVKNVRKTTGSAVNLAVEAATKNAKAAQALMPSVGGGGLGLGGHDGAVGLVGGGKGRPVPPSKPKDSKAEKLGKLSTEIKAGTQGKVRNND